MANPYQGDDDDYFAAARDKEGNIKQTGLAKSAKLSTFGAAFNAARKAGDKTFMFKGKKYTTEMAKPKPKAAPAAKPSAPAAKPAAKPVVKAEKIVPGVDDTYPDETARGGRGPDYTAKMRGIVDEMMTEAKNKRTQAESGSFKKGGMVKAKGKGASRADGCATKGRTKGRMV